MSITTILLTCSLIYISSSLTPSLVSAFQVSDGVLYQKSLSSSSSSSSSLLSPRSERRRSRLFGNSDKDNEDDDGSWTVSLSGIPSKTDRTIESSSPLATSLTDYVLSVLTSDLGSIIIGLAGLSLTLVNRLSSIDFSTSNIGVSDADAMGMQSRSDLLAVFASGAVLLNGISKLDVTSVKADEVVLDGTRLAVPLALWDGTVIDCGDDANNGGGLRWAVDSVVDATPADSVTILLHGGGGAGTVSSWVPVVVGGIVPSSSSARTRKVLGERMTVATPILDRFLTSTTTKESYLPTLQALPGKVEFTYLPSNAQEALLIPIPLEDATEQRIQRGDGDSDGGGGGEKAVLVLGGATAKSFSPKDVAWCQVLASRIGKDFPSSVTVL